MGGDHVALALGRAVLARTVVLVLDEVNTRDPIGIDLHLARHGLVENAHVAGIQCLGHGHGGVVLGLDRADRRAAGIASAHPAAVIALRVAPGRGLPDVEGDTWVRLAVGRLLRALVHRARDVLAQALVDQRRRDAVHAVFIALREGHAQVGLRGNIGGHAHFLLSAAVGGLQVVVADRPVDPDVVRSAHAEVVGQQAQGRAHPMPHGAAANPLVGAGEQLRPFLYQVALLHLVRVFAAGGDQVLDGRPWRELCGRSLLALLRRVRRLGRLEHRGVEALQVLAAIRRNGRA
ncbi:hypothetical protein D3C72_1399660 [compost metagenome]